ncbi:relaxase/mobilization nuclease domain-containing protein [Nostoc punctiforme]|uniref:Relaxase/mobilization nuclease family protein n=1 Tax=Nostoc punctiforme (strain ATCC 29133 / PCC 73102) TaxID=63737 RepID=B2JC05_NOSP7|nr:relaxase/mobilization nuclease domain-containing protein [Nostoc punctiforme]ACC85459.1 Relaxase/mobilization nuclease family protein [Nostoc punctiforme PCC 73102]
MITKVKANKSFRGTTKYVLEKEKAKIIGGNMYGKSTNELVEQFTLSAHLNPQLKDPCYHLMLSVPQTDRTLNDDVLANLSQRHLASVIVLSRLQGDESQVKQPEKRISDTKLKQLVDEFIETELPAYDFFIARHSDKEHDHTHIVASRVNNLDGKSIRTWNNYAYSEHSARLLEREFKLTQVQSSWESKQKAMTRNQLERVEHDGLPGEEIMRRAIEQVAVNKPTMPQLIEHLWREHQVKAIVSYYDHGGVRGIKFGIDVGSVNEDGSPRLLWKQGGNLNKYKCSFTKLQTELGISYDPKRDDGEIKQLNNFLESVANNQVNQQLVTKILPVKTPTLAETISQLTPTQSDTEQQANSQLINSISDFIEQSVVESALIETLPQLTEQLSQYRQQSEAGRTAFDELLATIAEEEQLRSQRIVDAIADFIEQSVVESTSSETLPELTEQLSQYHQQLANNKTTFDDLLVAITELEQRLSSQKAVDAVADFIEQSVVESALVEALPQLKEQLFGYWQQLKASKIAFNDFETALTAELQSHAEKRAILSISDYIDQSAIESALTQTVLGLTEQLSAYQQQLQAGITTFDGLETVIVYLEQLHSEQRTVDANALNKAQIPTTDKPKFKEEQRAELYKYYSTELQNLLVTDRDKEIAMRALKDDKPVGEVEEILQASPAGWTQDEARELVLIASNQLATQKSEPEQSLDEKQRIESEFLAMAVPIAVELINWKLRETGSNSLRFKRATLEKQGRELVFTHDERGESFRVAVNRNSSGELEYSPINVGSVETGDIIFWQEAERVLQQIRSSAEQQLRRQDKGISL